MNSSVLNQIKLSQLRAFVAVADRGNFGEAALHLEVSQSAVSHAIAALEEELGIVLLARGRHGAHLTPVGEQVVSHARQILLELEHLVKEANLSNGLQGGQVRIASLRSVATHILPDAIAKFRHRFSAIAVSITEYPDYHGVDRALKEGYADVGFTYLPNSDEFETWELLRDEYIAIFPATFKLKGTQLSWEQLCSYPFIMTPDHYSCNYLVHSHCTKFGHILKVAYTVREDSTIVSMVARGLGATILPRLAAEPIPEDLHVYSLPTPLERIIGVSILTNGLQVPAVYAFLDTLKQFKQI
jgi:DNA-binding transcriptional LysR family regulator